jgi:fluoroacetyl-CoA thioesterase
MLAADSLLHTTRRHSFRVGPADVADFTAEGGHFVHNVCSTFRLARAAEWAGRLFVLDLKEAHEEGVGTYVYLDHHGPAFIGETVDLDVTLDEATPAGAVACSFAARVGERLVAAGRTGQRILPAAKLAARFEALRSASGGSA